MASIQVMQETMQRILFRAIDPARSRQIAAGFSLLLGYFVLRKASDKLSLRAHNNYVLDKTWDWGKELVVITGGCSGIGAKIVSMLAAKNVKVIIFDIIEPKSKLGGLLDQRKDSIHVYSLTNFQIQIASSTRWI